MRLFSNLAEKIPNNRRHPWKAFCKSIGLFCYDFSGNQFLHDLTTLLKQGGNMVAGTPPKMVNAVLSPKEIKVLT